MHQFTSRVRYSEVNEFGFMSTSAIMRYMTDCSMFHSIAIDYDLEQLNAEDLGWYITEWQIRINKRPVLGQEIVIKTWPYKFRAMMGFRNFTIETLDGERLVEADSMWILMNLKKLKPATVPAKMAEDFTCESEVNRKWLSRKIPVCDKLQKKVDEGEADYSFKVRQMHIDTNHHMNNSRYIEAAIECLDDDFKVSYLRASYKQVAYKDDVVKVSSEPIDNAIQVVLYGDDTEYAVIEMYEELDKIEGIE